MAIEHLKTDNFDEKIAKGTGIVLVDFYADWCGPCKMIAPVLEEIAEKNTDITVYKVNTDEENSLTVRFRVMQIPTLLLFKDGELVKNHSGLLSRTELEEFIKG